MRADLGWSYAQAGAMNTANAAGYLLGALAAKVLVQRHGARPALLGGLVVTALSVLACVATGQFAVLLGLRLPGREEARATGPGELTSGHVARPIQPPSAAISSRRHKDRERSTTASPLYRGRAYDRPRGPLAME